MAIALFLLFHLPSGYDFIFNHEAAYEKCQCEPNSDFVNSFISTQSLCTVMCNMSTVGHYVLASLQYTIMPHVFSILLWLKHPQHGMYFTTKLILCEIEWMKYRTMAEYLWFWKSVKLWSILWKSNDHSWCITVSTWNSVYSKYLEQW